MYIGFFDSGIGGITVLYDSLHLLRGIDYLYYADIDNVPYGTKDKKIVKEYIFKAVDFIVNKGVDGLVIACNTATSIAIRELRSKYQIPIIGMEPAVKPAVERCNKNKRVLVLATPLTLKEDKYEDLVARVDEGNIVDSLPLPGLVDFAEKYKFQGEVVESYLLERLAEYNLKEYGTLVLGCTHFIFFRKIFRRILPADIDIIDGNIGTVRHLSNLMGLSPVDKEKPYKQIERIRDLDDLGKLTGISFFLSGRKGDISFLNRYLTVLEK